MKKAILFCVLILIAAATPAEAFPVGIDTNCDQAKYYGLGKLCQDSDDGKLYKGTGAAVVEVAAGASGDMTKAVYDTDEDGVLNVGAIPDLSASYEDAGAVSTHAAQGDPHAGYMLESNIGTGANNYLQLSATPGTPSISTYLNGLGNWVSISGDNLGSATASDVVTLFNLGSCSGYLKSDGNCDIPSGAGDVTKVGTPANHQWGVWTGDGMLEGVSVTAGKVACTDADGEPVACTNLTDNDFLTAAELTTTLGAAYDTEAELKALMPVAQAASVGDAGTLTPTAGYKQIDIALTCNSDPSAISLSETGVINNAVIKVTNVAANTCTFAYAAGVFEHKGGAGESITVEQWDSFEAQYKTDRWVLTSNESSTEFVDSIGPGVYKEVEVSAVDGSYDGTVITRTVDAGATSVFGQALHVDTDGEMIVADADVAAAMPALCLAVEAGTGSKKCLLSGTITETDWNWTVGGVVYVSDAPAATSGLTQTAPSTSGDTVQVVGVALTADTILVNMGGYRLVVVP